MIHWYSIDPRSGRIALYGYTNNMILEKAYQEWNKIDTLKVSLPKGEIPKHAEVHFLTSNIFEQTTPAYRVGKFGDKFNGSRDVQRYEGPETYHKVYIQRTNKFVLGSPRRHVRVKYIDMKELAAPAAATAPVGTPYWRWAQMTSDHHHFNTNAIQSFDIFNQDLNWRFYTKETNEEIEKCFQNGDLKADVEVGCCVAEVIFRPYDRELAMQKRIVGGSSFIRVAKRFLIPEDEMPMDEDESDDVCCLCTNPLRMTGFALVTLPCGHQVHEPCGCDLVLMNPDSLLCPLCRAPFDPAPLGLKRRGANLFE